MIRIRAAQINEDGGAFWNRGRQSERLLYGIDDTSPWRFATRSSNVPYNPSQKVAARGDGVGNGSVNRTYYDQVIQNSPA
jgi:hypothetical protein